MPIEPPRRGVDVGTLTAGEAVPLALGHPGQASVATARGWHAAAGSDTLVT
jgi:hypothetical protein